MARIILYMIFQIIQVPIEKGVIPKMEEHLFTFIVLSNSKLILTFVLGDFDPRSNNWCRNDTTSHQGSMIDVVTSN